MFPLMTTPELGMQSPAPGADSLLGLLTNILGLLAYLLEPLANILEPSPRQPHQLFARMPLQVHSHLGFTIDL